MGELCGVRSENQGMEESIEEGREGRQMGYLPGVGGALHDVQEPDLREVYGFWNCTGLHDGPRCAGYRGYDGYLTVLHWGTTLLPSQPYSLRLSCIVTRELFTIE